MKIKKKCSSTFHNMLTEGLLLDSSTLPPLARTAATTTKKTPDKLLLLSVNVCVCFVEQCMWLWQVTGLEIGADSFIFSEAKLRWSFSRSLYTTFFAVSVDLFQLSKVVTRIKFVIAMCVIWAAQEVEWGGLKYEEIDIFDCDSEKLLLTEYFFSW